MRFPYADISLSSHNRAMLTEKCVLVPLPLVAKPCLRFYLREEAGNKGKSLKDIRS